MIFLRRIGVERQLRRLTCRFSRKLGHLEQRFLVTCWADVAQLVEQPIRNRQVIGSSPIVGSSTFTWYRFQRFLPKSDDRLLTTTVSNNFSTALAPSLLQSCLRRFLLALLCYCGAG